jgi:CBS domain-containing protein
MQYISEIMTPNPVKVSESMTVAQCRELMDLRGRRHLPVVDGNGVASGLISDHALHLTPDDARASQAAVPAETCRDDTPLRDALTALVRTTLDCIVVVDARDHPVGIVCEHDIVRLAPALLAEDPLALRHPDRVLESVAPWAPRTEAFQQMMDGQFRHLPVVDGAAVVGVVSLRDLLAAGVTRGQDGPVEEVMGRPAQVAIEGILFSEAARKMADAKIGCLPILDFAHRPVGILTRSDVVAQVAVNLDATG